jgi:hypothetical protein
MSLRVDGICAAQQDGGSPTILAAGSAPGEGGVFVLNARFQSGLHLAGALVRWCAVPASYLLSAVRRGAL